MPVDPHALAPTRRTRARWPGLLACLALAGLTQACEKASEPAVLDAAAATDDAGALADTAADSADGALDAAADVSQVAVVAIGPGGTYLERCDKLASAICAQVATCCGGQSGDCLTGTKKACAGQGKFEALALAAQAGKLVLDPLLAQACDAALAGLAMHCHERDMADVLIGCMLAWVDPAELGQPCVTANNTDYPNCAGGKGRCVKLAAGEPNVYLPTCVAVAAIDAPCGNDLPCRMGGICSSLTGPKKCLEYGKFCWVAGDSIIPCPGGLICQANACVADPGAGTGQACTSDAGCKQEHDCTGGVCVAKVCSGF